MHRWVYIHGAEILGTLVYPGAEVLNLQQTVIAAIALFPCVAFPLSERTNVNIASAGRRAKNRAGTLSSRASHMRGIASAVISNIATVRCDVTCSTRGFRFVWL